MTSVYLATRVEETQRQPRHIVSVFDRLLKRRAGHVRPASLTHFSKVSASFHCAHCTRPSFVIHFSITSCISCFQRYIRIKGLLFITEAAMLKELGYLLYVEHPHNFIMHYIKVLEPLPAEVAQRAWNFLNDW